MEYTLGRVGIVVHDNYDPTKTYEALDLVPYQGGSSQREKHRATCPPTSSIGCGSLHRASQILVIGA